MIIQCEACQVSFKVDPEKLGDQGRRVRCSKCGHSWHQLPVAAVPLDPLPGAQGGLDGEPVETPTVVRESNPLGQEQDLGETGDAANGRREMPRVIALAKNRKKNQRASRPTMAPPVKRGRSPAITIGWVALLLFVMGSVGGALVAHEEVVERFPHMEPLYAAVGIKGDPPGEGLSLEEVTSIRSMDGDDRLLIIQGLVVNVSDKTRTVPELRASLTNAEGEELVVWAFPTANGELEPGASTAFETFTRNPPQEGTNLAIVFEGEEEG